MFSKSLFLNNKISRYLCSIPSLSCYYPPLPPRNSKRSILREDISWFPGHMNNGIQVMNRRMTTVDCVVEIHDARLPYTGRSDLISQFGQLRPHFLVMNKTDLAEPCDQTLLTNHIISNEDHAPLDIYFTKLNSPERQKELLGKIIKKVVEIFQSSEVHNKDVGILLLIAGSPNVGKSTFINAIRSLGNFQVANTKSKKKAAKVGKVAGLTRSVGEKILVYRSPPIYVYDSPGVFEISPTLKNDKNGLETILRLGVTGCFDLSHLNTDLRTMGSMSLGHKSYAFNPPDKGSFPLDHTGACKTFMQTFFTCLHKHDMNYEQCRPESRAYLQCRMDKGLMYPEDLDALGFKDVSSDKQSSKANS